MDLPIGMQTLPQAYGYDDVAIVPGDETVNPDMTDVSTSFDGFGIDIPFMASAMDSVVDTNFAVKMSDRGGVAVLNMDGLHTRYEDTEEIYEDIAASPKAEATELLQKIYSKPMDPNLVGKRVIEIKERGGKAAVSFVPQTAKRHAPIAAEAGADMIVVQGTVITRRHRSKNSPIGLILSELVREVGVPVVVGNTVSYSVTKELMEEGGARHLGGRRSGFGMHEPRGVRHRCAAGDGDDGVRSCAQRLSKRDRTIRFDHHRWWHPNRRRCLQVVRVRSRRGDDRESVCENGRGAGEGHALGHGYMAQFLATRHSYRSWRQIHA